MLWRDAAVLARVLSPSAVLAGPRRWQPSRSRCPARRRRRTAGAEAAPPRPAPMPAQRAAHCPPPAGPRRPRPVDLTAPKQGGAPPSTPASARWSIASAPICPAMQTLVGDFVQVGPDGSRTEGQFYLQKPGKVRFEYNPPSPIELIADGLVGGGARPQARDPGSLSAVADAAALPARRPHRPPARHQRHRRLCRRHVRHRGDRGDARRSAAPTA